MPENQPIDEAEKRNLYLNDVIYIAHSEENEKLKSVTIDSNQYVLFR